jgi:hypothetical protein
MTAAVTFFAKQINHGQSQVWLGDSDKELTPRRTLATNEVVNITRRLCAPEVFQAFYADYHKGIDHIARLIVPNMDELAVQFKLKA